MLVRELMTEDVVTIPVDATLQQAVGRLLEHGVGSVVIVSEGTPMGLVTETDALRAVHRRRTPLTEVDVRDLVSDSVVTTQPDRTVQHLARTMQEEGVKKVLVVEEMDVVGIVTLTDIVGHLGDIRAEAVEFADIDRNWQG